ncbi:MAG: FlgD immunoglobulin-like domain containing protein [Candidatus Eisenbacteria bacterium]
MAAISNIRVDGPFFSPNGDGVHDLARIQWSASTPPESIRVEIRPSAQGTSGPWVRAFALGPRPAGPDEVTWDGLSDSAAVLPEGPYVVLVIELTAAGTRVAGSAGTALITIDITPPPVPSILEGFEGRDTTSATLAVLGIARNADSVVVFSGGVPVDTVRVSSTDASFAATAPLIEGPNAIAAQSFDRAGNRSPLSPAVTVFYRNTATITVFVARPFVTSPNGDGVLDSARVLLHLDAPTTRLSVQVREAVPYLTGTTFADSLEWVRILHDGPLPAGEYSFGWDGRDSTGTAVPDGTWWFFAQAESADAAGNPLPGQREFTFFVLDRLAPSIPVPSPAPPPRTTRNSVTFTGVPVGTSEVADTVLVWRGGTVVGRDVNKARWSITVPLVLGDNTFTLEGADRAGNRSPMGPPITILYEEPLGFHAPERFRAGDVFDVNVARTARSVRIDLYDLDGRRVRTLLIEQPGQRYELPWDLRDDRGITLGDGPYVARVTVTYDDGVVETRSGAIVAAK